MGSEPVLGVVKFLYESGANSLCDVLFDREFQDFVEYRVYRRDAYGAGILNFCTALYCCSVFVNKKHFVCGVELWDLLFVEPFVEERSEVFGDWKLRLVDLCFWNRGEWSWPGAEEKIVYWLSRENSVRNIVEGEGFFTFKILNALEYVGVSKV